MPFSFTSGRATATSAATALFLVSATVTFENGRATAASGGTMGVVLAAIHTFAGGRAVAESGGEAAFRYGRLMSFTAGRAVATSGGRMDVCGLSNGVTVRDAVKAILAMWGQSCSTQDTPEKGEAVGFLNAAMQQLHASGKDFGFVSRINRSYAVPGTGDIITLETDVQHVEGNVVFDKSAEVIVFYPGTEFEATVQLYPAERTPLRPLSSSEAVESVRQRYGGIYNGSKNLPNQSGNGFHARPLAYFVRSETYSGAPRLILELAPRYLQNNGTEISDPTATLTVDLHLKPPRFSCCDVQSGIKLPVPHRYAESLLIPLARYRALSARYRVPDAIRAQIAQEAAGALHLLGEVDPRDAEVQRNRGEAKA